jgi:hypothetical protein
MEKDDTTYAIRSITFLTIEHARVGVVCLIVEDLGMLKRVREGDCLPVLSPRYGMFCLLAIDRVVIGTHSELSDQRRPYDVELTLLMAKLLCQYSSCSQLNVLVLTSSGAVLAGAEWAKWVIGIGTGLSASTTCFGQLRSLPSGAVKSAWDIVVIL